MNPEVSILAAGLFTCISIGLIYLTPTATLLLAGIKRKRRLKLRLTIKLLGLTWIAGLVLLTVSEAYSLSLICSVGAVTLVLSTIMLTGVGSALKLMNKVKR